MPKSGSQWRHLKSGHGYMVIGCGVIEATMADVVIYRRFPDIQMDVRLWIRPLDEFMDGRFKELEIELKKE